MLHSVLCVHLAYKPLVLLAQIGKLEGHLDHVFLVKDELLLSLVLQLPDLFLPLALQLQNVALLGKNEGNESILAVLFQVLLVQSLLCEVNSAKGPLLWLLSLLLRLLLLLFHFVKIFINFLKIN